MRQNKKQQSGFTLIELLVVIAIIGVLSTMAIIALGNARTKARDAKRVADIKQIATALELYYADNNSYPTIITPGNSLVSPDGTKTYMGKIPTNPTPMNDGSCSNIDYSYSTNSNNSFFSVSTCVGSSSSNINAGVASYSPTGLFCCGQNVSDIDGYSYSTVQIGAQCWLKQNLKTKTRPNGVALTNLTNGSERDCVSNNCVAGVPPYCSSPSYTYQRGVENDCQNGYALYLWSAAMDLPGSCDAGSCAASITNLHQGLCPSGWHIPTDAEWYVLENYLKDSSSVVCTSSRFGWSTGFECESAGLKLASDDVAQSLISCNGNPLCNTSGFSGYFAGSRSPDGSTFTYRGSSGGFISASEYSAVSYYVRNIWANGITGNYTKVIRSSVGKTYSGSVRCLKN
ncbi:MAG: prepilin-type N-terminal cleavage/methylation domain-containing protein [Candidatus Falkowbacteria bacterium]|nr:prepilin-type N-terminal cleavage/methylation domain-containing protein [Candidatus Falkowbacteria bacterium]